MAQSLSYKEAVAKGLVYPGQEDAALKLTGGGKGFADTEAYKQAFEKTYEQQKSGLSEYQKQIDAQQAQLKQIQKDRDLAQQARSNYQSLTALGRRNMYRWRDSQFAAVGAAMGREDAQYRTIMAKYNIPIRGDGVNIAWYDNNKFTSTWNNIIQQRNDQISNIVEQRKKASGVIESAMAKYREATAKTVSAEKRDTGAEAAARKRLTRGTAGLLAKAGAGGMVGTGLPMLGEGTAPALGQESQLGRKVTL